VPAFAAQSGPRITPKGGVSFYANGYHSPPFVSVEQPCPYCGPMNFASSSDMQAVNHAIVLTATTSSGNLPRLQQQHVGQLVELLLRPARIRDVNTATATSDPVAAAEVRHSLIRVSLLQSAASLRLACLAGQTQYSRPNSVEQPWFTKRSRTHVLREVMNGIRYVQRYGIPWNAMPKVAVRQLISGRAFDRGTPLRRNTWLRRLTACG